MFKLFLLFAVSLTLSPAADTNETTTTTAAPTVPTASPTIIDDDDAGIYGEESSKYHDVTFAHVAPLGTISTWLTFLIVCVASSQLGGLVSWIGLPLITGYIAVGVICGPDVLELIPAIDIRPLNLVTQGAMAFICFSAGAELYLPELRNLFKKIFFLTACSALLTFLLATAVVYGLGMLLPFWDGLTPSCKGSVASITAAIMASNSPASTIAITKEMKAKGTFTSSVLGVTVLGDVFVILLFSLTTSLARTTCNGEEFSGVTLLVSLGTMAASVVIGYIIGRILIIIFAFRFLVQRFLILPIGLAIFVSTHWLSDWSIVNFSGFSITLESLMICIMAGYVCTNKSAHRYRFISILSSIGPYVFLPFFTLIGASIHLQTLVKSLVFAVLVALFRALTIFIGSSTGGYLSGTRPFMRKENMFMWMCLLTQAGVSVGLASEVNVIFPHWGRSLQTALVTCILFNQIMGPIAFRWAIRVVGEADKQGDFEEFDPDAAIPRLLVVGASRGALAVSANMLKEKWNVTMLCNSEEECKFARDKITAYGVEIRKLRDERLAQEKAEKEAPMMKLDKKQAMEEKVLANAAKIRGRHHSEPENDVSSTATTSTTATAAGAAAPSSPSPVHTPTSADDDDITDITIETQPRRILEEQFTATVLPLDFSKLPLQASPPDTHHRTGSSKGGADVDHSQTVSSSSDGGSEEEKGAGGGDQEFDTSVITSQFEAVFHLPEMRNLAAIVIAQEEDAYGYEIARVLRELLDRAPNKSTLHSVRLLALLKSPFWASDFEDKNIIPLHPELHTSYVAAKLLSVPFTKPLCLHPALDIADLSHVVGRTLHGEVLKRFTEDSADTDPADSELDENASTPRNSLRSTLIRSNFKKGVSKLDLKPSPSKLKPPKSPSPPNTSPSATPTKSSALHQRKITTQKVKQLGTDVGEVITGGEKVGPWAREEFVEQLHSLDENRDFTDKEYL